MVASAWTRYQGPRGGKGWKNESTGEIRYVKDKPGDDDANPGVGEYIYHGTNETALENIYKEGLKPGRRGLLSLSKDEEYAKNFARDGKTPYGDTKAVLLRVNRGVVSGRTVRVGKNSPETDRINEILTKETIPPDAIEMFSDGEWNPLIVDAAKSQKQESVDVSPSKKSQTETPEFKRWFGNSKVVDEDGEPLVVYHGTTESFTKFDPSIYKELRGVSEAIFFTNNTEVAGGYANSETLDIKRATIDYHKKRDAYYSLLKEFSDRAGENLPSERMEWSFINYLLDDIKAIDRSEYDRLSALDDEMQDANDKLSNMRVSGSSVMPVYLKMENPKIIDAGGMDWVYIVDDALVDLDRSKNDGLIIRNVKDNSEGWDVNSDTYVVFDPGNIKSATGNSGNFDPDNPNIRMSAWVPYRGPRDGRGWKHSKTGEVRYQDRSPHERRHRKGSRHSPVEVEKYVSEKGYSTTRIVSDLVTAKVGRVRVLDGEPVSVSVYMYKNPSGSWSVRSVTDDHGKKSMSPTVRFDDKLDAVEYAARLSLVMRDENKSEKYEEGLFTKKREVFKDIEGYDIPKNEKALKTERFKKWFGDWENDPENSSKVVDDEGRPREVFHGTSSGGFTEFSESDVKDGGFFFASDHGGASSYVKGRAVEGLMDWFEKPQDVIDYWKEMDGSVEGPLYRIQGEYDPFETPEEAIENWKESNSDEDDDYVVPPIEKVYGLTDPDGYSADDYIPEDDLPWWANENMFGRSPHDKRPRIYTSYLNIRDPLVIDADGSNWDEVPTSRYWRNKNDPDEGFLYEDPHDEENWELEEERMTTRDIVSMARDMECDGVIIKNVTDSGGSGPAYWYSMTVYVAFKPEQIKSADNIGLYDPKNPNIRMSSWSRYEGPRGGRGWVHGTTGEVRYQDEKPQDSGSGSLDVRKARPGSVNPDNRVHENRVDKLEGDSGDLEKTKFGDGALDHVMSSIVKGNVRMYIENELFIDTPYETAWKTVMSSLSKKQLDVVARNVVSAKSTSSPEELAEDTLQKTGERLIGNVHGVFITPDRSFYVHRMKRLRGKYIEFMRQAEEAESLGYGENAQKMLDAAESVRLDMRKARYNLARKRFGHLIIDGATRGNDEISRRPLKQTGILAHEIGHVLDLGLTGKRISETPEWEEAWDAEISDTGNGAALSVYGAQNPGEGWAEFTRLVLTKPDLAVRDFPKCWAIWRKTR